jgi:hypothetical protein
MREKPGMMNRETTYLLAWCLSIVMLFVPAAPSLWLSSMAQVEAESETEVVELTEICCPRFESRRLFGHKGDRNSSWHLPDSDGASACCRSLRHSAEHVVSFRLSGGQALAPLIV